MNTIGKINTETYTKKSNEENSYKNQAETETSIFKDNEIKENEEYQKYNLNENDLESLVNDNINSLLKQIENGNEDKSIEEYKNLLKNYGLLYGLENVNIENDSVEAQIIKNKLEKEIETKLNEGKEEKKKTTLEKYITKNCDSINQQELKREFLPKAETDNNTEEDLLNIICDENEDKKLNKATEIILNARNNVPKWINSGFEAVKELFKKDN